MKKIIWNLNFAWLFLIKVLFVISLSDFGAAFAQTPGTGGAACRCDNGTAGESRVPTGGCHYSTTAPADMPVCTFHNDPVFGSYWRPTSFRCNCSNPTTNLGACSDVSRRNACPDFYTATYRQDQPGTNNNYPTEPACIIGAQSTCRDICNVAFAGAYCAAVSGNEGTRLPGTRTDSNNFPPSP